MTTTNTLFTNAERNAAVRLVLGAALAHEATAKLSNSTLAHQIGCGETTVRRYRKIAAEIGLIGTIRKGSAAAVLSVPNALIDDIGSELMGIRDASEEAVSPFGRRIYSRTCILLALLDQNPTREDLLFLKSATERLSRDAEPLDAEDFEG